MNIFNQIIDWLIAHKDPIITAVIVESIVLGFFQTSRFIIKKIPKAIKRLMNIKGIKYLGFMLLYAFPLGTMVWMIVDQTNEPTFKNIAFFILICSTLIFNILMNHIITLYKMIKDLANSTSKR